MMTSGGGPLWTGRASSGCLPTGCAERAGRAAQWANADSKIQTTAFAASWMVKAGPGRRLKRPSSSSWNMSMDLNSTDATFGAACRALCVTLAYRWCGAAVIKQHILILAGLTVSVYCQTMQQGVTRMVCTPLNTQAFCARWTNHCDPGLCDAHLRSTFSYD